MTTALPQGVNAAPLKPFLDLRDRRDKSQSKNYLTDALKELYRDKMERDKAAWREMVNAGELVAFFLEGKQMLTYNRTLGSYVPVAPEGNDPMITRCINMMQYFFTNGLSKWDSSNPDVLVTPYSNADQAIAKARKANTVVEYLEHNMFGKNNRGWFQRNEALAAQIWGWYGRRVTLDRSVKDFSVIRNILGEKNVKIGEDKGFCAKCGYTGSEKREVSLSESAEPMPQCPECGSLEFEFTSAQNVPIAAVVDQQKIFLPEVKCEALYFPAVRFDLKCRMEESSWAIIEKNMSEGAWRRILGDIRLPQGESGNEFGLEAIERLASAGSAVSGVSDVPENGKKYDRNNIVDSDMFFSPEDVAHIKLNGDERTVGGYKYPKGATLADIYPNGGRVQGLAGMQLIYNLVDASHKNEISTGVFHMKPFSGTGRGQTDMTEGQKQMNRRYSQMDKHFDAWSTPATLWAENAIDEPYRKLLGMPDVDIPVKMQNFPGLRISDLVFPLQPKSIPSDLYNFTMDNLQNFMQITSHITSLAGGTGAIVDNDTATGARILDANADALFLPMLSGKADVTVATARNAFDLWCKHTPVARFIMYKQASPGGQFGIEVSGEEVQGEYSWSYVPGSEQPKTRFTILESKVNMYSQFGGILPYLQAKTQMPEQVAEIERDFDVEIGGTFYDTTSEICRLRFNNAQAMMQQAAQTSEAVATQFGVDPATIPPVDPMQVVMMVEPSMEVGEGNHQGKMKWFSNLLDTDEGRQMSREIRQLAGVFIQAHMQLAAGQQLAISSTEASVQQAVTAPQMEEQQAAEARQLEAQSAQEGVSAENDAKARYDQFVESERQRAHESETQTRQQQHEKELAKLNASQKVSA